MNILLYNKKILRYTLDESWSKETFLVMRKI